MESENLSKYIGLKCTILTVNTIEYEFYPYKIIICEPKEYDNEIYLHKKIRCLIKDGFITNLHLFTFQTPFLTAKKIKKCKINSRNFTYDGENYDNFLFFYRKFVSFFFLVGVTERNKQIYFII